MRYFVSYSSKNGEMARWIREDLTRARGSVWIDDELTGGQAWWNTILENIRTCDLFVFLLSPDSLKSKACQAELRYAIQCRRPLLPVMVAPVSVQLAPREIADAQIVSYTERTADSAVALITAALAQPPAPPLPDPLPEPPAPPLSYMNAYREQIQGDSLSYRDQAQLMIALRSHLHVEEERDTAEGLLIELRRRPDIVESVGRDIDELIRTAPGADPVRTESNRNRAVSAESQTGSEQRSASHPPPPPWTGQAQTTPSTSQTKAAPEAANAGPRSTAGEVPAGWRRDPRGRYEYRYWDGTRWTDHVSRNGIRAVDAYDAPPTESSRVDSGSPPAEVPGVAGPVPAFTGGMLALLIIATVFVGPVGIIVGALNLKHKPRHGQSQFLLWLGIVICVLWILTYGTY